MFVAVLKYNDRTKVYDDGAQGHRYLVGVLGNSGKCTHRPAHTKIDFEALGFHLGDPRDFLGLPGHNVELENEFRNLTTQLRRCHHSCIRVSHYPRHPCMPLEDCLDTPQAWNRHTSFISTHLTNVTNYSYRWLITILKSYVDYGTPIESLNAHLWLMMLETARYQLSLLLFSNTSSCQLGLCQWDRGENKPFFLYGTADVDIELFALRMVSALDRDGLDTTVNALGCASLRSFMRQYTCNSWHTLFTKFNRGRIAKTIFAKFCEDIGDKVGVNLSNTLAVL